MEYEINKFAELASEYVNNTNRNLFLTGKAGTGKTTFLTNIRSHTFKNVVVAAPTGIAAINAGGVTLHSLFHLPFGAFVPENNALPGEQNGFLNTPQSVLAKLKMNSYKRKMLRELDLLIIDEVSMLRADLLDCIDVILRHVRRRRFDPFGGVQLLLIGDMHQLPPVVKQHEWVHLSAYYKSMFFFDANSLKENPPLFIELEKIYRQSDQDFIDILNRLRNDQLTQQDAEILNGYYRSNFIPEEDEGYVHVTTHNRKAELVNNDKLKSIDGKAHVFEARISGDFPENMYPALVRLELKVGAQVMFIKNDAGEDKRFFNGKIGKVKSISSDELVVECGKEKEEITLQSMEWENIRFTLDKETGNIEEKMIGTFSQMPLRLAWAITVHKSQGLTFEKAILDLSDVFAAGQMYVALSRLRSLDGLVLFSKINLSVLKQDEAVVNFNKQKSPYDYLKENISEDKRKFIEEAVCSAFDFQTLMRELSWHKGSFNKGETRSAKQPYLEWTNKLINGTSEMKTVADKFNLQVRNIMSAPEGYLEKMKDRIEKACSYFEPLMEEKRKEIEKHIDEVSERKRIKGYAKELDELELLFRQKLKSIRKAFLLVSEISENRQLTKDKLKSIEISGSEKKIKSRKKKDKTPTKEISYKMFKEGLSLDEIAIKRGFVSSTILGHLSNYVATGDLDVLKFISQKKLDDIISLTKKLKSTQSGELKTALGDEFSYADIKLALAHLQSQSDK